MVLVDQALDLLHNTQMPAQKRPSASPKQRPPTEFEARLHAVCKRIPRGKVATYGQLAKVLGSAPRAVGQALRRNPYAPVVPCHRVIAASLELGGFSGSWVCACVWLHMCLRVVAWGVGWEKMCFTRGVKR